MSDIIIINLREYYLKHENVSLDRMIMSLYPYVFVLQWLDHFVCTIMSGCETFLALQWILFWQTMFESTNQTYYSNFDSFEFKSTTDTHYC